MVREAKRITITSRDVQGALRLRYLDETRPYVTAGTIAVTEYNSETPELPKEKRAAINHLRKEMKEYLDAGGYAYLRLGEGAPVYMKGILDKLEETGAPPELNLKTEDRLISATVIMAGYLRHRRIGSRDLAATLNVLYPNRQIAFTAVDLETKASKEELLALGEKAGERMWAEVPACLKKALAVLGEAAT